MAMVIYNTLTRQKEKLVPTEPGHIRIYVCGPTTYNLIHLGNARPMVVFDTLRRYLEYLDYRVTYVQNFTDIDDKIIDRAQEEKIDALALSRKYMAEYFQDAAALGVWRANFHPRVTQHMAEIIDLIQTLIARGYAYQAGGNVYFAVRQFAGYGKLSGRSLEEMIAGARVEVDPYKKDALDFALWKAARAGEPSWPSPWGEGRPGWHTECAAMALKYLGPEFDIHGGGYDLVFPHHENEIAQAESYTGRPFARYWMHNGFITVDQEKMSKSLKNFFLLREILDKVDGRKVRFYLLSTHYRSQLDFTLDNLEAAARGLRRLEDTLASWEEILENHPSGPEADILHPSLEKVDRTEAAFRAALDDDFNTSRALACLFELAREVNQQLASDYRDDPALVYVVRRAASCLEELGGQVLGVLDGEGRHRPPAGRSPAVTGKLVDLLLEVRQEARERRDWGTADRIRDGLSCLGIAVEDTPAGARWRWERQGD